MPYDWTKHVKDATIEGRAVEGGGGSGVAVVKALPPKGVLLFNRGVTDVIESLPYFDNKYADGIYDVLVWILELDSDLPILTAYNRRALAVVLNFPCRTGTTAPLTLTCTEEE